MDIGIAESFLQRANGRKFPMFWFRQSTQRGTQKE
jgi:hypothetical protein